MRYAIIADIHANLAALTAVLSDIEHKGGVDELWCLGDIVGYGPDPGPCIELLRRYRHVGVAGNHDRAAIGKLSTSFFNPFAVTALEWTAQQLQPEETGYLESLPLTLERDEFLLVHGSPSEPLFEYVISTSIAARNFSRFQQPYCLVGHSHKTAAFKEEDGEYIAVPWTANVGMILGKPRLILNPGSVGQPRDGDPRAGYAVYDSESRVIRLYRIPYDVVATQDKMMQAGLPVHLTTGLKEGR